MAVRIRWNGNKWIALCAARTKEKPMDVYIDDNQDHALRRKYIADYIREGLIPGRVT
jgi:hypothetical protein